MAWKRWDQSKTTFRGSLSLFVLSSWPVAPSDRSLYWNSGWYQKWTWHRLWCQGRTESRWLEAQRRYALVGRSPGRWSRWTSWRPRWPWWRHQDTRRTCLCSCCWVSPFGPRPSPAPPRSRTCCRLRRWLTLFLPRLMGLLLQCASWFRSGSCHVLTACWSLKHCSNYHEGFAWISLSCRTFHLLPPWCLG